MFTKTLARPLIRICGVAVLAAECAGVVHADVAADKDKFWENFEAEFETDQVTVLVGGLTFPENTRFSSQKLMDIESLLIQRIQARGNIQAKNSRIERPGMVVKCRGGWDGWEPHYYDG